MKEEVKITNRKRVIQLTQWRKREGKFKWAKMPCIFSTASLPLSKRRLASLPKSRETMNSIFGWKVSQCITWTKRHAVIHQVFRFGKYSAEFYRYERSKL